MHSNKIAFLAYYPERRRFKNNSFYGNFNIGANVIIDVLRRKGIECDLCTPDTAKDYGIVLISLTSEYDCIAFYKAVALLPSWQPKKRKFIVIAGGAGLQNPMTIRRYIDYGVFGRGEEIIYPLLDCILGGGIYEHESVMNLPDISPVTFKQASGIYPYEVCLGEGKGAKYWKEPHIGCLNKCLFCHYTWSRKKVGGGDTFIRRGEIKKRTSLQIDSVKKHPIECLWKDIPSIITEKEGVIRSAIDGFSEKLREVYGKKITNKEIIESINHVGSFGGTTFLYTYNISNMPHETLDDREELYETLKMANPKDMVIVVLQSTPFRPSALTPLQWAPVALYPAASDLAAEVVHESPTLRIVHSFTNESPWSQLMTVIVMRATVETDKLFHVLCFSPKLKKGTATEKIRLLQLNFDLSQYLKEYEVNEQLPAWYLSSYTPNNKLRKLYDATKSSFQKGQE